MLETEVLSMIPAAWRRDKVGNVLTDRNSKRVSYVPCGGQAMSLLRGHQVRVEAHLSEEVGEVHRGRAFPY